MSTGGVVCFHSKIDRQTVEKPNNNNAHQSAMMGRSAGPEIGADPDADKHASD